MRARVHVCVYTSTGIFIAISSARLYSDCQATVYRHLADSRAKRPDMDSREMARCFFSDENEKQRRESVLCPLKSDTSSPSSPSPSLVGSWPVVPTNLDFRFFPFPSFPPPLFLSYSFFIIFVRYASSLIATIRDPLIEASLELDFVVLDLLRLSIIIS